MQQTWIHVKTDPGIWGESLVVPCGINGASKEEHTGRETQLTIRHHHRPHSSFFLFHYNPSRHESRFQIAFKLWNIDAINLGLRRRRHYFVSWKCIPPTAPCVELRCHGTCITILVVQEVTIRIYLPNSGMITWVMAQCRWWRWQAWAEGLPPTSLKVDTLFNGHWRLCYIPH
jgi:hypothetical protein